MLPPIKLQRFIPRQPGEVEPQGRLFLSTLPFCYLGCYLERDGWLIRLSVML